MAKLDQISIEVPVLIAGGGPVGMTLALELARYGVRSMLVEKNTATTTYPKMDITNGRSMELFRRLGLIDDLRAAGVPSENPFDVSWVTSLSGHELYRFQYDSADQFKKRILNLNDGTLPSEAPLRISQVMVEPVLKARIDAHPLVDVHFGVRFERILSQDDSGVLSKVIFPGNKEVFVRSQYLAGCDGGSSTVRTQAGISLDGEFNYARAFMIHFRSEDRALLQRWGKTWHYQNAYGSLIAQNDKDIWTLQAWILPGMDETNLSPNEVLEQWVGQKFKYEIIQSNPWGAHFVVADQYVNGRVALAGDSAHQFVPTGGYGMNSGIADAIGLGWVLASQIQEWGYSKLLTSYDLERRPVAWNCLHASKRHMKVRIAIADAYLKFQDLEGTCIQAEKSREHLSEQIALLGNAENESWGVELGYRYDNSPVIIDEPNPPEIDPLVYDGSTWPGSRLPNLFLEDGAALHDHLGLHFTLLVFGDYETSTFEDSARFVGTKLSVVKLNSPLLNRILDHRFLLIRPDQHIAWRGNSAPKDIKSIFHQITGG